MCHTTISDIDDMNEISSTSLKKTAKLIEPRKIRKPLMEKKRRARINQSLDELKRIVVDAEKLAGQDVQSRMNKLEKADILEMTVRYLKRKATLPPSPPPTSRPDVYLAGYRQCIEQVQELLAEQWTDERRQQSGRRVVEHLEACVQRLNVPPPKNRLLSSDKIFSATLHFTPDPVRNSSSSCFSSSSSSSDDDSVEEELITASAVTSRPLHNLHTTEYCDSSPKPMWRPW